MKRFIFLILPIFLSAQNLSEILKRVDNNLLLKSKDFEIKAKELLYESNRGKNLPSIDASLNALYLKETPKIYMNLNIPNMPKYFQAGSINQYTGELSLTYPIFTGFAITNLIDKSKLEVKKSILEKDNLKRNLYMKTINIYTKIYSLNQAIKATKEALKAINLSYKKAKGFYNQGLIPPSELYNIESKKYEIESLLNEYKNKRDSLFEMLDYITNSKIKDIGGLKEIDVKKSLIDEAIENREDILAIKELLNIDEKDIKLAKSSLYPKLFFKGAIRKYGKNLKLNGDGYKNADESYVAFNITQNIFNGFSDKKKIEAAKYKKLATLEYLKDYQKMVKSSLISDFKTLNSLKLRLISAKKRVKAAKSYEELIRGRFDNQLSSADELSRAISSLAEAKAKYYSIKAAIFNQKCQILLKTSLKRFKKYFD